MYARVCLCVCVCVTTSDVRIVWVCAAAAAAAFNVDLYRRRLDCIGKTRLGVDYEIMGISCIIIVIKCYYRAVSVNCVLAASTKCTESILYGRIPIVAFIR